MYEWMSLICIIKKRPRIYVSQGNDVSSRAACNYGRGALVRCQSSVNSASKVSQFRDTLNLLQDRVATNPSHFMVPVGVP